MKKIQRMMSILIAIFMILTGCASAPVEETNAQTIAPTETVSVAQELPTEAAPTEPVQLLAEVELPKEDIATGTLCFYFGDKVIYAGGSVADILDIGIQTYTDLNQMLNPGHMSDVVRVRIEDTALAEKDRPFVFFVAVNPADEPRKLSECMIYSLTINTDKGIAFGSGQEAEHFYTGKTTYDQITAAYGKPDYEKSRKTTYREIAYYEPFSCAYFSFKNGVVRQIFTYYSANIFEEQAEAFDYELTGYFGNDCYILMNQYLDVKPYLPAAENADNNAQTEDKTGILTSFVESIKLGGQTVEFGKLVEEMPSPYRESFAGLTIPLYYNAYMTVGRNNPEEFWMINSTGQAGRMADKLVVKGVITKNCNFQNWGVDNSLFHTFEYDGLTQDVTIEEILEKYGAPKELSCTSNARKCFAWMEYEDENGNYVHFCVDPMLDQLIEIHVNKYFPKERHA